MRSDREHAVFGTHSSAPLHPKDLDPELAVAVLKLGRHHWLPCRQQLPRALLMKTCHQLQLERWSVRCLSRSVPNCWPNGIAFYARGFGDLDTE